MVKSLHLGRRKYLIFLTFAVLSLLVIVVNRFLATGLTVDNDGFEADVVQTSSSNEEKIAEKLTATKRATIVTTEKTTTVTTTPTSTKTTTSTMTTSHSQKVAFLKPINVGTITTQSDEPVRSLKYSEINHVDQSFRKSPIEGARYIPQHRIVHLDFKGAPPKLSFLKTLFPMIKDAGATAVMLEYEDMFPFWGSLRNISAKNAFSGHDIQTIQAWAVQNDLIVIPLIQTFGHLEFVLKLDEFKHLREVPIYPQSICPSKDESWRLLTTMIDQGNNTLTL